MKKNKFKIGGFNVVNSTDSGDTRFTDVEIDLVYTGENDNKTNFKENIVEDAFPSLNNIPILGFVNGSDYAGHEEEYDDEGNVTEYYGQALGVIPESCNARFVDLKDGKRWLRVDAIVWNKIQASNILLEAGEKSHSIELNPNNFAGEWKNGIYHFSKIEFEGACILGDNRTPAMKGSKIVTNSLEDEIGTTVITSDIMSVIDEKMVIYNNIVNEEGGSELSKKKKKFWRFTSSGDSADLFLLNEISDGVSWWGDETTPTSFKQELDALGDIKNINVYINSPGGSVFGGIAIGNLLKMHKATVNAYVIGLSASIASVITMSADNIFMYPDSVLMVHKPSVGVRGNADDLAQTIKTLDTVQESIMNSYMTKTKDGVTREQIEELVNASTWMSATEASEFFNLEIYEDAQMTADATDFSFLTDNFTMEIPEKYAYLTNREGSETGEAETGETETGTETDAENTANTGEEEKSETGDAENNSGEEEGTEASTGDSETGTEDNASEDETGSEEDNGTDATDAEDAKPDLTAQFAEMVIINSDLVKEIEAKDIELSDKDKKILALESSLTNTKKELKDLQVTLDDEAKIEFIATQVSNLDADSKTSLLEQRGEHTFEDFKNLAYVTLGQQVAKTSKKVVTKYQKVNTETVNVSETNDMGDVESRVYDDLIKNKGE